MNPYRSLSFWHDSTTDSLEPRPALSGDAVADVAIVGAGYTGLWTAYYLKRAQPDLRVIVIEAEIAGYGASGRNGGWCAGEIAGNRDRLKEAHGAEAVVALYREMFKTVDEVGKVASAEGIDCDFQKGGILTFATNEAHVANLRRTLADEREWGFDESDFAWLSPGELPGRVGGALGAIFTPHAAAINPFKLVRGLARAVEALGVKIFEQTQAIELKAGVVKTTRGEVRSASVIRATEVFSVNFPGHGRDFVPAYSLMIATEPLGSDFWDSYGFAGREVFNDARQLIIYGQRTADDRLAFGGRGARYHFGSALRSDYDRQPRVHEAVGEILWSLFPDLGDTPISHRWGGAVALPRDWRPAVVYDRATGLGHAGGYAGEGVAASNLAGRTLADLILGRNTDLTRLLWVGHRSPKWEPEPLRFLGANLATALAPAADRVESRTGKPSRFLTGALRFLTGR
ncbi:MAG: NAD(P)/FAD-dependent oxidoreductase [Acidimicrobiia bacterium]